MNTADILRSATARLESAGIESARLDAEVLLSHVLNCRRKIKNNEDVGYL